MAAMFKPKKKKVAIHSCITLRQLHRKASMACCEEHLPGMDGLPHLVLGVAAPRCCIHVVRE